MSRPQELLVAGGGPVGLAFALAAAALPEVRVTVVEKETAPSSTRPADPARFDHRIYALSPASMRFLDGLGVWQRLDARRIAAVDAMQVFGDGEGAIEFRQGAPLAFILEHGALLRALQSSAANLGERLQRIGGAAFTALDRGGERPLVRLDSGQEIATDLLIGADGAQSQVRAAAGIGVDRKDYLSDALVANFHCERAHGHVARQWFLADAVLAWLPLPDGQISIVWSVEAGRAAELAALDAAAFATAVAAAGGDALGCLTPASPVARFPLRRQLAHRWTAPGLALIGDAAHAIHPLAGQGVNLGLGDAQTLFEVLRDRGAMSHIGDVALLRKFERRRREHTIAMAEATDRLRALYLHPSAAARKIRNLGISTVDRLPFLKHVFMDYAMN